MSTDDVGCEINRSGPAFMTGGALTKIETSSSTEPEPSLAGRRRTYEPPSEKLAVVSIALALPNVTDPGPLTFDHVVLTVPGGLGRPSSVTVPSKLAEFGS